MDWVLQFWGIIAFCLGAVVAMFAWFVRLEVRLSSVEQEAKLARAANEDLKETNEKIFLRLDRLSVDLARMAGSCIVCKNQER